MRGTSVVILVLAAAVIAVRGAAQETSPVALNVHFLGYPTVGITIPLSARLAVRPELLLSRTKSIAGTTTQVAFGADVLLRQAVAGTVGSYWGVGGLVNHVSFGDGSDGTMWMARTLFGVRVRPIERVSLFSEVWLSYSGGLGSDYRAGLGTTPIAVSVELK